MDNSLHKSRKGTRLNNAYYFRQPPPRARNHMRLLRILSEESKKTFSRCKYDYSSRFKKHTKVNLHESSKHIAMVSFDFYNQKSINKSTKDLTKRNNEVIKNNIEFKTDNIENCYSSKCVQNTKSEYKKFLQVKADPESSKSVCKIIPATSSEVNRNSDDIKNVKDTKAEEAKTDKCENNSIDVIKNDGNIIELKDENVINDSNGLKFYDRKHQLYVENTNLEKKEKKILQINNFNESSDYSIKNHEGINNVEKSWWKLIIDFFSLFTGKKDNYDDKWKRKTNIQQLKPQGLITAKPGYPDINNAYKSSNDQNMPIENYNYDVNHGENQKIRKKKKKHHNVINEKSKMRKISSPLF